jgi:hypothetical protein
MLRFQCTVCLNDSSTTLLCLIVVERLRWSKAGIAEFDAGWVYELLAKVACGDHGAMRPSWV